MRMSDSMTFTINDADLDKLNDVLKDINVNECPWFEVQDKHGNKAKYYREPRKKGKWVDTGSGQECSECHEIQYGYDSFRYFCAFCGADMREGEEE